jgi:hypothetical protein
MSLPSVTPSLAQRCLGRTPPGLRAVLAGGRRASSVRPGVTTHGVRVTDCFEPPRTAVAGGAWVRLRFHRAVAGPGSDVVVFPALGRLVTLRVGCDITLDLGPLGPGEYVFQSRDGATTGTLVVVADPPAAR